jgi:hypothetical protein
MGASSSATADDVGGFSASNVVAVKHGKISFALFVEDIAGASFSTFQLTPARTQRPTAFRTVARPAVSCNFNRLPRTCISVELESEFRNSPPEDSGAIGRVEQQAASVSVVTLELH